MLTISGLTKSFASTRVLDCLDLQIAAGESVALLGANGSGKTTTIRCVVGLARPDGGRIEIGGIDISRRPLDARRLVSYLPQKPMFPPTLTVRETLGVVADLRQLPVAVVDRELEACALTRLADRGVNQLSGGERQRLAMAVAFLPDASLFLFDEPSANLDPAASRLLFRRARQLTREGKTLLFTTHVPADVRFLASRVLLLRDGRIESDAAGAFELRRYERMLERDLFGDDQVLDESPRDGGDRGADDRLRRFAGADAGARAAGSR